MEHVYGPTNMHCDVQHSVIPHAYTLNCTDPHCLRHTLQSKAAVGTLPMVCTPLQNIVDFIELDV